MPDSRYDCIVIGSGPGGYVAAIRAAQLGMKTAVVEKEFIGGRCLNIACIPAKAVLRAADVLTEVRAAGDFGIKVAEPEVDFAGVGAHRDKVVKTLTSGVSMLLKKNKVDVIEGEASLTKDGNVAVGGNEIEAGTVILATGSVPKPVLDLEFGSRVLDTAAAWLLNERPNKLAVIGAGASGTEIASAYGRLGTEVVLLEALEQILPLEDKDIARTAAREIGSEGIKIVTGANITKADVSDPGVTLDWGDGPQEFDYVTIAAGRAPDVEALGLADAGIETDERGQVKVDGHQKTSRDGVYAIGDIVPGPWLAHKASEEGVIAVEAAAGQDPHPIDHSAIPAVTFCYPQVASFGLTEEKAKEAGYDVVVGKVPMGAVGAPTVYGDRGGMIKIVGDKNYGEILGAHMVSVKAADLIEELVVAKELEGGYPEIAKTIHPHPAFAEAVLEAARATDGWLIHG
ncbi:MAG TPA: dihydrolipoyl dehydrogenase [Thermoleophilaceae bacterium]|jgi:dihydrolipoamide dehydrogenase|nr:dihydrolipoyl dehydrogenase [Thermoleophilaceae bacterium]